MERKWRPTSEVSPDESSDVSDDSDSDLSKHDLTGTASETRESSKKLDPPARVASSSSTHDKPTPSDHGEPPRSWKSSVAPDRTLPTTSVKPVAKIPETRAQPSLSKAALEAEVQKKKASRKDANKTVRKKSAGPQTKCVTRHWHHPV